MGKNEVQAIDPNNPKKTFTNPFKTGDVVQHKATGQKMIVLATGKNNPGEIMCQMQAADGTYMGAIFEWFQFEGTSFTTDDGEYIGNRMFETRKAASPVAPPGGPIPFDLGGPGPTSIH